MTQDTGYSIQDLLNVMARLRDPESGCDWDLQQSYRTIAPSTIEEAYEVVDAIERQDYAHLKEELGDLLFQVIFYSQLAVEEERFDFNEVVDLLTAKLIRRHPHVFPEGTLQSRRSPGQPADEQAIVKAWEKIKQEERAARGAAGILDDVPLALPAMTRAAKLQKRASHCGFDWTHIDGVLAQLESELAELRQAIAEGDASAITDETGDVLFSAVNAARHLKLDPESVLRQANAKFERRFGFIEAQLTSQGAHPSDALVEEMEKLWLEAKQRGF